MVNKGCERSARVARSGSKKEVVLVDVHDAVPGDGRCVDVRKKFRSLISLL